MSDIKKSLRLDPDLAARVDAARGDVSWSRWVTRAIEDRLGGSREVLTPREVREKVKVAARRVPSHAPTCRCAVCGAK